MEKRKIKNIIITILLIIGLIVAFNFYKSHNFNDFQMSERNLHTSEFNRDSKEKYSKKPSYKITSNKYNDAMFYQSIKVKKDTPYKVTCMVKTKDVQPESYSSGSGAQISVEGTTERSIAISGTTDWQQIEMIINSKNREEINIGFRLGGYIDNCKGEAWFSDFKIEEGQKEETDNSHWNFACFIFDTLDTTIDGEKINYSLSQQDVADMQNTMNRFNTTIQTMSRGKMTADSDIYIMNTPITSLSYDEERGYYVAPEDVEQQIKSTINTSDYDHIFVVFKLADKEVKDWVGLGAMDYYGIGFSNIRVDTNQYNYLYKYDTRINTFPEEVFLHEFLHSFERTLQEYGYKIPELHDNEKYGYKTQAIEGLKDWYDDYMNCSIRTSEGYIGLDPIVYTLKPAREKDFTYSTELKNAFYEPQNIFEDIGQIFKKVGRNINMIFTHK